MNVDDHRAFAGEFLRVRLVEKSRHGQPIEALDPDQVGFNKVGRVQAARLACRPTFEFARLGVEGKHIGRRAGGGEVEGELAAILVPGHAGRNA